MPVRLQSRIPSNVQLLLQASRTRNGFCIKDPSFIDLFLQKGTNTFPNPSRREEDKAKWGTSHKKLEKKGDKMKKKWNHMCQLPSLLQNIHFDMRRLTLLGKLKAIEF